MRPTDRKVANESGAAMKEEIKSDESYRSRRTKRIGADEHLRAFFVKLATNIEALIDASPLGVPAPCEPWSPSTDKKKALLSNPISAIGMVGEVIAFTPAKLLLSLGAGRVMLTSLREALANAVLAEEAIDLNARSDGREDASLVMVDAEVDVTVPSEGAGEAFVDLRADQKDNSSRVTTKSEERKKSMSGFFIRRVLNIIDALTLRVNGIVVTADDCSVECSLDSLVDNDEFEKFSLSFASENICNSVNDVEDCPSVVTELAKEEYDTNEEDAEDEDEAAVKEAECDDDDGEYVITEDQPVINGEDFVDVRAEC
ncbi:hypothetical protein ACHAXA_003333 [Cyclostephanos tholiformis]|jgi:hypothetical protein|uniref:Uncharacterized protein n=1 Tax=Cyclostephanos tholiformis TaxID=382380 RepID=A0ABD3SBP2_9STRA